MKQQNLLLFVGIPASGKTTFAFNFIHEHPDNVCYVSRDAIRFEMLKDGEDYFAHEDDVVATFFHNINDAIEKKEKTWIIADATHLNEYARNRTLSSIKTKDVNIIPVYFNVPIDICMIRNCARQGRTRVPEKTISNMRNRLSNPIRDFRFKYAEVWEVNEHGEITKRKRN